MKLFLISYDLNKPGQDYADLWSYLQQIGAQRALYSAWTLRSPGTALQITKAVINVGRLDGNDRVLVTDMTDYAWLNPTIDMQAA